LAQHWESFGRLLRSTGDGPIVEISRRDQFWGARPSGEGQLVGLNVLGRLLRKLRDELNGPSSDTLRIVVPPDIPNFLLYGEPVGIIRSDLGPLTTPPVDVYTPSEGRSSVALRETAPEDSKPGPRSHVRSGRHAAGKEDPGRDTAAERSRSPRGRKPPADEPVHQMGLDAGLSLPEKGHHDWDQELNPKPMQANPDEHVPAPATYR
jgi:hypothetical protein